MFRKKSQFKQTKMRHLIAKLNPRSPISEQYRTIRTNLQFASIDKELRSILVTSANPSEGKSMTTANLAVVYAQQGKKVLLVDADLRNPTVHYTYRLDNLTGLSTILVGESKLTETIQDSGIDNLHVISAGPNPPNPAELLGSNRMKQFLTEADQYYDLVIIDSPPVLPVTDAQILANLVDGSLLVIRSRQTEYETAEKAIDTLNRSTSKILGTVLNDRDKKEANAYYYYNAN